MESEKAKAKAGKLYDANNDIELVSEREAHKRRSGRALSADCSVRPENRS